MRFRGPIDRGTLRHPSHDASMRHSPSVPLAADSVAWNPSFDGTMICSVEDLPLWQPTMFGTRAHAAAYTSRRQIVESANAGLAEAGRDTTDHKHMKVFGRLPRAILYAFEIMAYNLRTIATLDRIRAAQERRGEIPPVDADGCGGDLATGEQGSGSTIGPDPPG